MIVEDTMRMARMALDAAWELIAKRGMAANDACLRYELMSAAREISIISSELNGGMLTSEDNRPCLTLALEREISCVAARFSGRCGAINRLIHLPEMKPSWSSVIIFGWIARILLEDAVRSCPAQTRLVVSLRRDRDFLSFGIDGAGAVDASELMVRIPHPTRLASLLASLNGRIKSFSDGIRVGIPLAACTDLLD